MNNIDTARISDAAQQALARETGYEPNEEARGSQPLPIYDSASMTLGMVLGAVATAVLTALMYWAAR